MEGGEAGLTWLPARCGTAGVTFNMRWCQDSRPAQASRRTLWHFMPECWHWGAGPPQPHLQKRLPGPRHRPGWSGFAPSRGCFPVLYPAPF